MPIIQTIITEPSGGLSQCRGNVAFEVVLNKAVRAMPYLIVYQAGFCAAIPELSTSYTVHPFASSGNSFFFEILNQDQPKYFSLVIKEGEVIRYLIHHYHFEVDDDIVVKVGNSNDHGSGQLDFSGKGAVKHRCQTEMHNRLLSDEVQLLPQFTVTHDYNTTNRNTRNILLALQVLKKYQTELSAYSYELMKVDVMAKEWKALIANFKQKITVALANDDTHAYLRLCYEYKSKLKLDFEMPVPAYIQYNSLAYAHFMVDKIVLGYLKRYIRMNFVKIYNLISKSSDCNFRDKMILILLMEYKSEMKGNYNAILKHALTQVKNQECLDILMEI